MAEGPTVAAAKLKDEITCPLCLDVFNEPKMLPCHHVYCRAPCLEGLALRGRGTITCPECRNVTQVPGNDVNNVPTAFHINRLKEVHKVMENTDGSGGKATPTYNCQKHRSQSLDLYCKTCQKMICRDCVLADHEHSEHEYGYVVRIAPNYRQSTLKKLKLSQQLQEQLSSAVTTVTKMKGRIEDQKAELAEEINASFDTLTDVLKEQRETLIHTMGQVLDHKIHAITTQEHDLKTAQEELSELNDSVKTAVMKETNEELLLANPRRMMRITELIKTVNGLTLIPEELPNVGVEAASPEDLCHLCMQSSKVYFLADPSKCTAEGDGLRGGETGKISTFHLRLLDSRGNPCLGKSNVTVELRSVRHQRNLDTSIQIRLNSTAHYEISYKPESRGRQQLDVKVNGTLIAGSPFQVFIKHSPTKMRAPVTSISGLHHPTGLLYSEGELFVVEHGRCLISIFNHKYDRIRTIGEQSYLRGPSEVAIDQQSNIYICTVYDHQLHKFTKEGTHVKSVGRHGNGPGEFNFPNGNRVSHDNKLYVCDSENHRIQVLDSELNMLQVIGSKGSRRGHFNFPADVDFDSRGNLYVVDKDNHRIQVLTPSGKFLHSIGKKGENPGELQRPICIKIVDKLLYVTEYQNNRVSLFSTSGLFIATFGEGHLIGPEGITVDDDGFVYVTNRRNIILVF